MAHLYKQDWDRQKLARYTGTPDQVAGIRLVEALEGIERGSRRLEVWTGSGLSFTVLSTTDLAGRVENWTSLGIAVELSPGHYQFTDATANIPVRFYRVRSP